MPTPSEAELDERLSDVESRFNNLTKAQLAAEAVDIAVRQTMSCFDFKKPRTERLDKYWALYDGKVQKKLRQLFNVPIPVFPGMIDTLNAQYDTPIDLTFQEGDASDYFKVQKINGAFKREVMNTATASKWDSKLSLTRKHAIMEGRGIVEYNVGSDPEYYSELDAVRLKNFNFQPKGGLWLENHLFAGREDIEKTQYDLLVGVQEGLYEKEQVKQLIDRSGQSDWMPMGSHDMDAKLSRFKPLGLDPENNSYVGQAVYTIASHILQIRGQRYYLVFHPWTKTWLRFDKWEDNGGEYPWKTYATHEDDENFLSKSYGDDLYAASDAIVAMFNQELTNREKRNFGARAYDKDVFTDVRKLDEAQHRPDALVPADTKGGSKRISEAVFTFETPELNGTINLIDWMTSTLGRNTGATDLSMGSVEDVSKKASVTFAEQKSVSKRLGWGAQPFQSMMGDLGRAFVYGLRDHMPAKMAIRVMGEKGWDWDEITRLDLSTKRDVDVLIQSRDQQKQESEMRKEKRIKALELTAELPLNPKKRAEAVLKDIGDYDDQEVAEFLDIQTHQDRKSLAKASEAIQAIKTGETPPLWYGATTAFMQKLVDFATDNRAKYPAEYQTIMDYAMSHSDIVRGNIERKVTEQALAPQTAQQGTLAPATEAPSGMSGGMSRAMNMAEAATA
jgi:hypothetical protein